MSILNHSVTDYIAPGVTDEAATQAAERAAKIATAEGLPNTAIQTAKAVAIAGIVSREYSGLGGTTR